MYSSREVTNVLGLPTKRLRSYLRSGCVKPEVTDTGELRFSFTDLVVLRKVEGLVGQSIPPRRVARALHGLARTADGNRPLSGFDLNTEGKVVVAADGQRRWCPESGQLLLNFGNGVERPEAAQDISPLRFPRPAVLGDSPFDGAAELTDTDADVDVTIGDIPTGMAAAPANSDEGLPTTAQQWFERGCALENTKPDEARDAYRAAIALDSDHGDAHINLGRLLHESGHPQAAQVHYRIALGLRPEDATASFNLGVALEDLDDKQGAINAYKASIAADPANADAHFNVARLLEQSGKPDLAIRHLLLYRQLTRIR